MRRIEFRKGILLQNLIHYSTEELIPHLSFLVEDVYLEVFIVMMPFELSMMG